MKVTIKVIPHDQQRYPTVGDWHWDMSGNLTIKVSKMDNWKYEMLVAVHELVEVLLCKDRNISQGSVDNFDIEYEARRPEGDVTEPGDSPLAPYKNEHFFATNIERLLARELNVDWGTYDEKVSSL